MNNNFYHYLKIFLSVAFFALVLTIAFRPSIVTNLFMSAKGISSDDVINSPKKRAEIRDAVKMFVAEEQLMAQYPEDEYQIEKVSDRISQKWVESDLSFKELLEKDGSSIAKKLLLKYKNFSPDISEFEKVGNNIYTFQEKKTGAHFKVTIDGMDFEIETDDLWEYGEQYY